MPFIADLHIHSRYSRATSQALCFEELYAWGRRKGIALIGSGDCTHPGWLAEATEKLAPAGDRMYRLKDELRPPGNLPAGDVRFMLTGEISTIYKADGATRKVHHLVCLPGLAEADAFSTRLARIGNITSDGRPILGLDSRDLLEILLEVSPAAALIPAHIWTPWFSVLGSKSGFDSIDACYRDLAEHIFALETGLSSDPPMNWTVSSLDRYALVSNSDAHSPAKLGREANVFTCEVGYTAVMDALRRTTPGFWGTLEFFPEEGKYHYDGHRKCHVVCTPEESRRLGGRCPVCGGALTLGVEYRVLELADRPRGAKPAGAFQFQSLLSLAEILGELLGTSSSSKKVAQAYKKLLAEVGPELHILREAELEQIRAAGGDLLAHAIAKMRRGAIHAVPGYDGEYGTITVFSPEERAEVLGQIRLFPGMLPTKPPARETPTAYPAEQEPSAAEFPIAKHGLSDEQRQAVTAPPAPLLIVAGPGAGKTRTLVERIAWLVEEQQSNPGSIIALTFSNRAAREMGERLTARLGEAQPTVATFHRLGFRIINEHRARLGLPETLTILAEDAAAALLEECHTSRSALDEQEAVGIDALERAHAELFAECSGDPAALAALVVQARALAPGYAARKRERGAVDFTDLLLLPLALLAEDADIRDAYRQRWAHVFVDEYQDVNVLQYLLLRLLCPPGASLCAIGDPDQAIYGFRGADMRYFLRFQQDYPDAVQIDLTRNYRSCRAIVQASGQVIAGNPLPGRRVRWSDVSGPARLDLTALPTPPAEAEYVVQTIEGLLGGISHFSVDSGRGGDGTDTTLGFNDIAILTRTHLLGEEVAHALERSGIPYQRAARKDVFQRKDVRNVLEYLAAHPRAESWVGTDITPQAAILNACLALNITEETLREGAWQAVLLRAREAGTVADFLQRVNLDRDIDIYDPRAARVTLMTVHAAKGLEWDVVFMVGCEEGSFPHPAAPDDEERRLFYVGMTRARTHLHITYAESRTVHGERAARHLSPYLRDIDAVLLNHTRPYANLPRKAKAVQLTMMDLLE